MIKLRNITTLLAVSTLAALPACSDLMGGGRSSQSSYRGSTASSSTETAMQSAVAPDMVRQVQSKLQQDGYYKQGNVDGIWGAGTETALQAFQRDHSLTASGQLDVPTLQAMNVIGSNPNTQTNTNRPANTNRTRTNTNPNYNPNAYNPNAAPNTNPNPNNP